MTLVRAAVLVPAARAEPAAARLLELVPGGLEEREVGPHTELAVYIDSVELDRIREAFPTVSATTVAEGWEEAWRAFHRAVTLGRLWIGPPWETAPTGLEAIVVEPGRAFGTGAHPTTRLCIELLARQPLGSLLDVGCGSGVLAIVAARLGFEPVTAVDLDPIAIEVTRTNAAANDVDLDAFVLDATSATLPLADIAVANVLLDPVGEILARLRSERVVTSGYLVGERPPAPGWVPVDRLEQDGWAADVFARRG